MATLLFKLRNVPDDEADEVRVLLESNDIPFYETAAGNWGVSMPAIWLPDNTHYTVARALLDAYQQERQQRMRAQHQADVEAGQQETLAALLRREPLQTVIYLLAIAGIAYLSVIIFY